MKKIESLTKEQEALLTVYRDRWLKIGLGTGPADRPKAEDALRRAYRAAGLREPLQIVWSTSPLAGSITISVLKNDAVMQTIYADFQKSRKAAKPPFKIGKSVWASVRASVGDSVRASVGASVEDSVEDSVGDSVEDSVWASVGASVGDSVGDSVGASVEDSVGASVEDSVWASVRDSVRDSVWASVGDSVRDSVGDSVEDSVWASVRASVGDSVWASVRASVGDSVWASVGDEYWRAGYGSHDANWLGFYQYFLEVLKLESCEKLIPLMDFAQEGGWFYPYEKICVVSERPTQIHMKGIRIHKDGGPAVAYSDGFSVWALNGVRVPKDVAESPADKLSCDLVLKERNAEVRREIVRKIGIDRIVDDLGAEIVDKWDDYELLMLDLKDGRKRPYLKMLNPSIGTHHIEGVEPSITTVKAALAWRNGMKAFTAPKVLT